MRSQADQLELPISLSGDLFGQFLDVHGILMHSTAAAHFQALKVPVLKWFLPCTKLVQY